MTILRQVPHSLSNSAAAEIGRRMADVPYASAAAVRALLKGIHCPTRVQTPRGRRAVQQTGWAHKLALGEDGIRVRVTWDHGSSTWEPAAKVAAGIVAAA